MNDCRTCSWGYAIEKDLRKAVARIAELEAALTEQLVGGYGVMVDGVLHNVVRCDCGGRVETIGRDAPLPTASQVKHLGACPLRGSVPSNCGEQP